jgi:glycosyltransferase involved in cell wall biosynthesis
LVGAGGAREFVDDDAGCVVPYLDVNAMADAVIKLLHSSELRHRLGEQAQHKVQARHDITVAAPKILETIERFYQA